MAMSSSRLPATQLAWPISPYIFLEPSGMLAQPGASAASTAPPDRRVKSRRPMRIASVLARQFGSGDEFRRDVYGDVGQAVDHVLDLRTDRDHALEQLLHP